MRSSLVFSAHICGGERCVIKIQAKELEIKYNVSRVVSIFDKDITLVTCNENKQVTSLEL